MRFGGRRWRSTSGLGPRQRRRSDNVYTVRRATVVAARRHHAAVARPPPHPPLGALPAPALRLPLRGHLPAPRLRFRPPPHPILVRDSPPAPLHLACPPLGAPPGGAPCPCARASEAPQDRHTPLPQLQQSLQGPEPWRRQVHVLILWPRIQAARA